MREGRPNLWKRVHRAEHALVACPDPPLRCRPQDRGGRCLTRAIPSARSATAIPRLVIRPVVLTGVPPLDQPVVDQEALVGGARETLLVGSGDEKHVKELRVIHRGFPGRTGFLATWHSERRFDLPPCERRRQAAIERYGDRTGHISLRHRRFGCFHAEAVGCRSLTARPLRAGWFAYL